MTKHSPSSSTAAKLRWAAAVALLLGLAPSVHGQNVALWNFEDGTDGAEFTPLGEADGSGGSTDTVNAILMRGFNEQFGPSWTSQTPSGSGLAMNLEVGAGDPNTTSDGYATEGALHDWTSPTWTISTDILLRDIAGWRTMIGRDGSSVGSPESDFYLVKNGIDDRFRVNLVTSGGERAIVDGAPAGGVQTDTWYNVAAVSDGTTLGLFVDGEQVGFHTYQGEGSANDFMSSALNWTFGRGWYNGGFVDHVDGIMDNVLVTTDVLFETDISTPLELQIDPVTGEARLKNTSTADISIDYYRVDSANGSLLTADFNGTTGWDSLSDQGLDSIGPGTGESWDEATVALSASRLVEQFLSGDTTIAPYNSVSLGVPVNPALLGAMGDIEFRYAPAGGALTLATVTIGAFVDDLPGDFNMDGTVDAADYTVWRDNPGTYTQADYDTWAANYGATLNVGGAAGAVPEPTALLSVAAFGCLVAARRRRLG
ncbi:hypothetical protein Pla123a_31660 [Posidoniimonas polymericola]|uniref:LamG-like jellyroll fold domain-containing protein n=1 Tax=Posidoniimonas polymericola TaxID=2528002 RepID=A0A5C5YLC0_9BACT|nr:LamG domain-containing protein [Posidoniimonas polymericola]TWT75656.1 hypothetical protein Pla123a_31660 [Posidoniimonas polymericola]